MNSQTYYDKKHIAMLIIFFIVLIWSTFNTHGYKIWLLEAGPAIIMVLVLLFTYNKFRFTTFVYLMVFIHAVILLIGAKYTYQGNPLFNELQSSFDLSRNYYDRVGHLAQGFIPAFIIKEYMFRKNHLKRSNMSNLILMCIVLAISASYELLEFSVSLISGEPGSVILATQGDLWDTQWDMVMALIGGASALFIFGQIHDYYMQKQPLPNDKG